MTRCVRYYTPDLKLICTQASLREGSSENRRFPSVKMKMHIEEDIGEDIKAEDVDD